jgi:dihydroneopterin aldolase
MDRIVLRNMLFYASHGVYDEEAKLGQRFEVDVEIFMDTTRPGKTDDLEDTINYGKVYESVKAVVVEERFRLIEALAAAIAKDLLQNFNMPAVVVRVRKPHAPIHGVLDGVEIEIHRTRTWLSDSEDDGRA